MPLDRTIVNNVTTSVMGQLEDRFGESHTGHEDHGDGVGNVARFATKAH
jgi:hypothetical protein